VSMTLMIVYVTSVAVQATNFWTTIVVYTGQSMAAGNMFVITASTMM